jgi:hypothetical protein
MPVFSGCSKSENLTEKEGVRSNNPDERSFTNEMIEKTKRNRSGEISEVAKKCNFDSKLPSKESVNCMMRETTKLEGKSTFKEAYCERGTDIYFGIAMLRDIGAPIESAREETLEAILRIKNDNPYAGVTVDLDKIVNDAQAAINIVYSRPNDSPASIKIDMYNQCMNSEFENQ